MINIYNYINMQKNGYSVAEDRFSYYCKYNELPLIVANAGGPLLSEDDCCYIPIDELFDKQNNY